MDQELFKTSYSEIINNLLLKHDQVKADQEILKTLKEALHGNLEAEGLDRIENDTYKIMIVGATRSTGINVRTIEKNEPELYVRLLGDYLKVTERRSYLKVEYQS